MRSDSSAYEVLLEQAARLAEMSQGLAHCYSFVVARPSERLTAGVQCSLREPSGLEVPVTIVQLDGARVVVQTEVPISVSEGSYRLVFVPWFFTMRWPVLWPKWTIRMLADMDYVRSRAAGTVLHQVLEEAIRRGWLEGEPIGMK